jgi:hypothetical protein
MTDLQMLELILNELREHRQESNDRHEKVEARLRSLENTRAFGHGVVAVISAGVSYAVSIFSVKS